jgi:opacity protein-like surface antigen
MKKIILLLAVAVISVSSLSAQTTSDQATESDQKIHKVSSSFGAVGAHIGYAFWGPTVGLHGDFNANNFRGRAGFDLFFERVDDHNSIHLGADVGFHYLINLIDGLNVYPIIGVNIGFGKNVDFHVGMDFGAGIEYNFSNGWSLFLDGKYNLRLLGPDIPYRSYIGITKRF